MAGFRIIRATMADRSRIVTFLKDAFYKYRPLNIAKGSTEPSALEIEHSMQSFSEGMTFLAVSSVNQIVGVTMNKEITVDEVNLRRKMLEECNCKDFAIFLKFWYHIERNANFWKNIGETKALDMALTAVDPNLRGQGVAKELFSNSKELAKKEGYKVFRADCSSYIAGRLANLLGMTCVYELKYHDYREANGNIVFKTSNPHDAFKVFKLKL